MTDTIDPITISVDEASKATGFSRWVVYKLLDEGAIESRYQGRRRLVVVESLREYVRNLPTTRPETAAS